jgi:hypothetical protein
MAAAVAAAVVLLGPQEPAGPGSHIATGAPPGTGSPGDTVTIALVGYAAPVERAVPKTLRDHLSCMRDHGYDIPDPEWTGHGWLLTIKQAKGLGVGTAAWKKTAFITCALTRPGAQQAPGLRHALLHPRPRGERGS